MKFHTRMYKRTIFAAAIGLLLLVVAACSNHSESPAASDPSGTAAPEKRATITSSIYDRGNVPAEEGTIENNRWTRWLSDNGPADVKFTAIPRFDSIQKYNTLFASNSAPDLIFEYDSAYRHQLYTQKQLLPLDDLLEENAPDYYKLLEQYPLLRKLGTKDDGKLYELGTVGTMLPTHVLFIRADWLEKLNLKVPETAEELFETAKAFATQDPDGNNQDDTYGMSLSFVSGMTIDYMFGNVFTIFEKYPWYVQDGELVHDWDRSAAAVAYKKRVYDEGLVDKDFLTDSKGEKARQDWINGKLGIYGANAGLNDVATYEALVNVNPDAKILPIALPGTEFGKFSPAISSPIRSTAVVNAKAKNPAAVLQYVNFLIQKSTAWTLRAGLEGEHFEIGENGCPVLINPEKRKTELGYQGDLGMLSSLDVFDPSCSGLEQYLNPDATSRSETEMELLNLRKTGYEAYIDKERPNPMFTLVDFMPALPSDLQLLTSNAFNSIQDIWVKTIVGGSGHTVEQAVEDAKAAWEKASGAKVDEWYAQWYKDNKDSAILMADLYDLRK